MIGVRRPRAALGFVMVTVALDMLAMGVVTPMLPHLVLGFVAGDTARAARVYDIFGPAWALMRTGLAGGR